MKAEDLFKQDNTLLLDGGMGTMLQAAGLALGVNAFNALIIGLWGLPGVGLLFLLRWVALT